MGVFKSAIIQGILKIAHVLRTKDLEATSITVNGVDVKTLCS